LHENLLGTMSPQEGNNYRELSQGSCPSYTILTTSQKFPYPLPTPEIPVYSPPN